MLSFMQALRLSSVRRDRRLDLIFLRYENDCSHAYVEPNKVNTHTLPCMVCDRKRVPSFDNQLVFGLKSLVALAA